MNNIAIIAQEAIINDIFTEDEIDSFLAEGREIPLHTFDGWKARGYIVRKGEKGIETRLWKLKLTDGNEKAETEEQNEMNGRFVLTKAYLFRQEQVDKR